MSPNSLSLSGLDSPPPGTIVWWKLSFWGSAEDICSVAITWLMISQGIFFHQILKYWTLTELNFCIDFCLCFEKHVLFVCLFVWLYIVESYFGGGTSAVLPLTPARPTGMEEGFWFRMKASGTTQIQIHKYKSTIATNICHTQRARGRVLI